MPFSFNVLSALKPNTVTLNLQQIQELKSDCQTLQLIAHNCLTSHASYAINAFDGLSDGLKAWIIENMTPYIQRENVDSLELDGLTEDAMSRLPSVINALTNKLFQGLSSNQKEIIWRQHSACNVYHLSNGLDKLKIQTTLETVRRWVEESPQGENRKGAGEKIEQSIRNPDSEVLDLSGYALSSLPDIFAYFQNKLGTLDLRGNQFETLPLEILRQLHRVDIDSNTLTTLPLSLFDDPQLHLVLRVHSENKVLHINKFHYSLIRMHFSYIDFVGSHAPIGKIAQVIQEWTLKGQTPTDLKAFVPSAESISVSGQMWDCLGEYQERFLFACKKEFRDSRVDSPERVAAEKKFNQMFPANEPMSGVSPLGVQSRKYFPILDFLGISFKEEVLTVDGEATLIEYLICPKTETLRQRWEELRKRAVGKNLPELKILSSSGIATDKEFIEAFFICDLLSSNKEEFLHDMSCHIILILLTILEFAEEKPSGYYIEERNRLREVVKNKYQAIQHMDWKDRGKYLLPVTAMLSAFVDRITNDFIHSHEYDAEALDTPVKTTPWKAYFIKRFGAPESPEHIPGFDFNELCLSWIQVSENQRNL